MIDNEDHYIPTCSHVHGLTIGIGPHEMGTR